MNQLTVSSVVLLVLQSVISAHANVKITPIAVENKNNMKASDLKEEEARYRDPIMPEYYMNGFDRNRQNFVTSNAYGGGLSNYDRYGYNSGGDRYGSSYGGDRYGLNYDRYGSQWNRDRTGSSKSIK